jgi:hypothetical protein
MPAQLHRRNRKPLRTSSFVLVLLSRQRAAVDAEALQELNLRPALRLFTMVGIAGEDDLDAPPDVTNDPAEGHKAFDASLAPDPSLAPVGPR